MPAVLTGAWLRALREAMMLSQAEFASKINVRQQTYSKWERDTSVPRTIAKAAIKRVHAEWKQMAGIPDHAYIQPSPTLTPIQNAFLHFVGDLLQRGQLPDQTCVGLMTQLSCTSAAGPAPTVR